MTFFRAKYLQQIITRYLVCIFRHISLACKRLKKLKKVLRTGNDFLGIAKREHFLCNVLHNALTFSVKEIKWDQNTK